MIDDLVVRPLLGDGQSAASAIVCPPAAGWQDAFGHVVRRLSGRWKARRLDSSSREAVLWGAAPGRRTWLAGARRTLLSGRIYASVPSDAAVRLVQTNHKFTPRGPLQVGAGGGLRQVGAYDGRAALLRLGTQDTPADPSHHFAALAALHHEVVPSALADGETRDVRWTVEGYLTGTHVATLTRPVIDQIDRFLAELPMSGAPIGVLASSGALLGAFDAGSAVQGIVAALEHDLEGVPAVTAHGDLWAGNVLFRDGRLVGVLDWDSWQERAVPGTDIIHCFAEQTRRRLGLSYGDLVERRFWQSSEVAGALESHLQRRGMDAGRGLVDAIGRAWWLTTVAGALRRTPDLATRSSWLDRNVGGPLRMLSV